MTPLPVFLGIVINHYKDPHEPIRIQWKVSDVFFFGGSIPCHNSWFNEEWVYLPTFEIIAIFHFHVGERIFVAQLGQLPNFRLFFGADPRAFNSFGKTRTGFWEIPGEKVDPRKGQTGFGAMGLLGFVRGNLRGLSQGLLKYPPSSPQGGLALGGAPLDFHEDLYGFEGVKGTWSFKEKDGFMEKNSGETLW